MEYGKIIVQGLVSENSDYSNPFIKTLSGAQTETPTEYYHQIVSVPTTYHTVDFTALYGLNMESVTAVAIRNRDSTNYVTAIWYSLLESIANPGGSGITFAASAKTITDAASGASFANADVGDILFTSNAEDSNNRNSHTITAKGSSNVVTVSTSLTDDTGDTTATFLRGKQNHQLVRPGRWLVIPGDFMIRDVQTDVPAEIYIQANTSAVECEIFAFST